MGMGELLIIAVMGLLVLGPERMPVAIRTVSQWIRSAKQMATSITSEINQELKASELHQNLKKAEDQGLSNLSPELNESLQELKDAAASVTRQYDNNDNEPSSTTEDEGHKAKMTVTEPLAPDADNPNNPKS
jgi:sec-independent protein translocase protein TatB